MATCFAGVAGKATVACDDGTVCIWDIDSGKQIGEVLHYSVAVMVDFEHLFVIGTTDGSIVTICIPVIQSGSGNFLSTNNIFILALSFLTNITSPSCCPTHNSSL
jgi:WD40 repeat protein